MCDRDDEGAVSIVKVLRIDTYSILSISDPPKDDGDLTISGNLKSFEGPVLHCRVSTTHRELYLNELVIHEIRNNVSEIFQNFLFICCKIEFVHLW